MNSIRIILIFLLLIFSLQNAFCANRYWVGGTGLWTDAASHWATSSGGSPSAGNLPSSSDDVYFDSNSGTGSTTVNSNVTIVNLTFSSSCSSIILDITSNTMTISSTSSGLIMNSGNETLRVSGGTLTITNTTWLYGGILQLNSGIFNINCFSATGTYGLNIIGTTVNCAGATVNIGNGTNEVLALNSGTLTISGGTINIRTEFYTLGGTLTISGGTINVNTCIGSQRFYSIYMGSTTYNLTGGIIDIKNVAANGNTAIRIDNTCTTGILTGSTITMSATNGNYYLMINKRINNLEINSSGQTATLTNNDLDLAGNLTLTSGTFDVSAYNISLAGNWTKTAGVFNYNTQTVLFNGTSLQQISGTTATSFYNLTLNNSSGLTLTPNTGIKTTVRNTLTLSNGKISLENFDLNIGSAGVSGSISNGNSSNYIITNGTGVLRQYNIGTGQRTSAFYPIGISSSSYTPITLTVSGASIIDDFSVAVSQNVFINGTSGSIYTDDCVNRTWNITEGTTTGSSITISPQWNGSDEFTSFTRSAAYIGHYTGGNWVSLTTGSVSGPNPYTCTSEVVTSFSPFAVFDPILLPVEMISFEAKVDDNSVNITWKTSSEINCDYYRIKKSSDGIHFFDFEDINQNGDPFISNNYKVIDQTPFYGVSYYQLNQFDFDGNITYSDIRSVKFNKNEVTNIYPNPIIDGKFNLSLSDFNGDIHLSIYDCNGKLVHDQDFKNDLNSTILVEINNLLSKGIYHIQISNEHKSENHKLYIP